MKRLVTLSLAALYAAVHAAPPAADKAKDAVEKFLTEAKVPSPTGGTLQELSDASLANAFPSERFFLLRFPMYPVARLAPAPLKSANIFAVTDQLKVSLITDDDELLEFFKANAAKAPPFHIATAWGALAREFADDGFYHLILRPDWIKVEKEQENKVLKLVALPAPRTGSGEVTFYLTFDHEGRLVAQRSKNELKPAARPVCQAMLLDHSDPILRAQAEQVLLWMGLDALPYLCERIEAVQSPLREKIQIVVDKILVGPEGN